MYKFDEKKIAAELANLPYKGWLAFAAAASTRQLKNYERFAHNANDRPRVIINQLWDSLITNSFEAAPYSEILEEIMETLPEENEDWKLEYALVDDALSSLAYTIRCMISKDKQEAIWAARRAYEAADQLAILALGAQLDHAKSESLICSHLYVQRELERQSNDLILLSDNLLLTKVKLNAFEGDLITDEEISSLFNK